MITGVGRASVNDPVQGLVVPIFSSTVEMKSPCLDVSGKEMAPLPLCIGAVSAAVDATRDV